MRLAFHLCLNFCSFFSRKKIQCIMAAARQHSVHWNRNPWDKNNTGEFPVCFMMHRFDHFFHAAWRRYWLCLQMHTHLHKRAQLQPHLDEKISRREVHLHLSVWTENSISKSMQKHLLDPTSACSIHRNPFVHFKCLLIQFSMETTACVMCGKNPLPGRCLL